MFSTDVEMLLFIRLPLPFEEEFGKPMRMALKAMQGLSNEIIFESREMYCFPEFELLDDTRSKVLSDRYVKNLFIKCKVVRVTATIVLEDGIADEWQADLDSQINAEGMTVYGVFPSMAHSFFKKRILDFIFAINLAHVGSIECMKAVLFDEDNNHLWYSGLPRTEIFAFRKAVSKSQELKWPEIKDIDLKVVWKWLNKRIGFMEGFSKNAVDRALIACSRLFDDLGTDGPHELFWALLGIEALYVKGKASILDQVRDKAQSLLGEQEGIGKKMSKMYDVRSRYIHGDMNFTSTYPLYNAFPEFDKYGKEVIDATSTAAAILISTIQKMILNEWGQIDFQYNVIGH